MGLCEELPVGYDPDGTVLLSNVRSAAHSRLATGFAQDLFGKSRLPDGSINSGMVSTSLTLIGGCPGAGKSTLLLQIMGSISKLLQREALYIAAEEAEEEIKLRADRLGVADQGLVRIAPAMGGLPNLGEILQVRRPCAVVLDSLFGLVGSDRAAAEDVIKACKRQAVSLKAPIVIIQQVIKSEDIAGAMADQHGVDTVMKFYAQSEEVRELEVEKNRFGQAHISQFFRMTEFGLVECEQPAEASPNDE